MRGDKDVARIPVVKIPFVKMPFVKMHGTGNDFVMIDARHGCPFDLKTFAICAADRNFGIGSDGVIYLCSSTSADYRMDYYNRDGSATTCGNGIRCLARFIVRLGLLDPERRELSIETAGGVVRVTVIGKGERARVDMGQPILEGKQIPVSAVGRQVRTPLEVGGKKYTITAVGMGNPHCVIFVDDVQSVPLATLGPQFEHHQFFPQRTNVEFVQVLDEETIKMRIWERGVGETLSCGTGACASLVAAVLLKKSLRKVKMLLPGGELEVAWDEESDRVFLTGPAEETFYGEANVSAILQGRLY